MNLSAVGSDKTLQNRCAFLSDNHEHWHDFSTVLCFDRRADQCSAVRTTIWKKSKAGNKLGQIYRSTVPERWAWFTPRNNSEIRTWQVTFLYIETVNIVLSSYNCNMQHLCVALKTSLRKVWHHWRKNLMCKKMTIISDFLICILSVSL